MRICFVTDFYPPHIGGGEIYIQKLVEGLAEKGDECLVITSRFSRSLPRVEKKGNIRIIRIGYPPFSNRACFIFLSLFAAIICAGNCDIINGVSFAGAFPAFAAAKVLKKRSVLTVYEFLGPLWKGLGLNRVSSYLCEMAERMVFKLPIDVFVASSLYSKECLRGAGIPEERIEFVYSGENRDVLCAKEDKREFRKRMGFNGRDFVYLLYGRVGITKGMEFFIDAVPDIIERVPQARFIFILAESGRARWSRMVSRIRALPEERYRFFNGMPREKTPDYLAAADCIVVPSLSESFGFAAVEAATLKKRIVATNAGALPEVVFGEHLLVKSASSEALAVGCERAFRGDMDYCEPKVFDWGVTVDYYRNIYKERCS